MSTNTYALNVIKGQEFTVEAELKAMGLNPWFPKRLVGTYVNSKVGFSWYEQPYVEKLGFCVFPAVYFSDVADLKHVLGKPVILSWTDIRGVKEHKVEGSEKLIPRRYGLVDFRAGVEMEYHDALRRKLNSDYECHFTPGQALKILKGAFAGFPAEFTELIKDAEQQYQIRVETEVFGRKTQVTLAPDMVGVRP